MNDPGTFSLWLAAHKDYIMLWIGAICTLGLYSVLYKENKIYRLFEHIFLGLATGYLVAITWTDVLLPKWWENFWGKGQWWWIFALTCGLLYYFIYSKKYNWLARLLIGFFLGTGAGQAFQGFVNDIWPQILGSFKPLRAYPAVAKTIGPNGHPALKAVTWPDAINNIIFMVILLCVMSYFFFSFEQKNKVIKTSAQWGRWMMMFTFGAIFGSTIMARLALLIDRMDYLMNDFGPEIGGPVVMFAVLMVLTALVLYLVLRKNSTANDPPADAPAE